MSSFIEISRCVGVSVMGFECMSKKLKYIQTGLIQNSVLIS